MQDQVEENGFDLLEVLAIVAENLKLLILGPILAGLIGLAMSYTLPKSFTSRSILSLPTSPTATQAAAIMLTPVVLDSVIAELKLAVGRPMQVARAELAGRIKAVVGKDLLLRLDVTAPTAAEAQATANAILDVWLKSTRPSQRDREGLVRRVAYAKASLESVRRHLTRLALNVNQGTGCKVGTRSSDDVCAFLIELSDRELSYSIEILTLERSMEGLSRDVLVQEPTLPFEPSPSNMTRIAVWAALLCAFLLLLWVFMTGAWKLAAQDPVSAEKMERIRDALGFKHKVSEI